MEKGNQKNDKTANSNPKISPVQKFKDFLSLFPRFIAILIFLKCLLKHGYEPAKEKFEDFWPYKAPDNIFKITHRRRRKETNTVFDKGAKISVVIPVCNTQANHLKEAIKSVINQTYSNWDLCLADGSDKAHSYIEGICKSFANKDERILYKKFDDAIDICDLTNAAIGILSGDFIGILTANDLLHPSALFEIAKALETSDADMLYTDEATFKKNVEKVVEYAFKPDYSPDTLRSCNYISHFTVFSRELMQKSGGFDSRFSDSYDYDFILRLTENAKNIVHIKKALYFVRMSASLDNSTQSAPLIIAEHLKRQGLKGQVLNGDAPATYRIKYEIEDEPLISIMIPTKDHIDDLDLCLQSIFNKSSYKNYEIIIIENNSTEPETFAYYEKIKQHEKVQIVYWEHGFNYSAINNFGLKYTKGDYILLLNNDVEVLNEDWLQEMLMFAMRPEMGAVGAKLYYPDDTIQHAGVIVGLGGVAGHSHKNLPRNEFGFMSRASIAQNLSACTAACLMIPRKVYEEVGGLEESFAVAFNDVDLCMKIRKAGYLIVYTPYTELYHYESKSRGFDNTPEKKARFNSEVNLFRTRWKAELKKGDPYYNPNLTYVKEDFSLDIKFY